jgi:cobalt transporter subunit CbtA
MFFRGIIFNAVMVGLLAGVVLTVVQLFSVVPIIFAAEAYESAEPVVVASHDHGEGAAAHHHDAEAWGPADGIERSLYTLLSNVLAGIGFAAVLLALMAQLSLRKASNPNMAAGLLWGLSGFIAFFLWPAIGLPPEIPGVEAAVLESRQGWWMLAVGCAALALAVAMFAPLKFKIVSVVIAAWPFIIGAPHSDLPMFSHDDPAAVEALTQLHQQFVIASSVTNLVFWLVLGMTAVVAVKRVTRPYLNAELTPQSAG